MGIAQDVRYAFRWFRRDVPLTGAIVLTLAFGIGLNSGVFSVLSGMVFRSRVEKDSASFFQVLTSPPGEPDGTPHLFENSLADLRAIRSAPGVASAAAWTVSSGRLEEDADPSLLLLVSCDFFGLYGLEHASLGRLFDAAECEQATPVMLLGEQLWRDRFHADAGIVGRNLQLSGRTYTVAGILPREFPGRLRGRGIWIPLSMHAPFFGGADLFRDPSRGWLTVEGRSRPGYSRRTLAGELRAMVTPTRSLVLTNGSIIEDPSNRAAAGAVTLLLGGALGLILLLACTNVTMLLLSRAVARRYEMSVRLSVGASYGRLLRMAATEGILLALLSGAFSAALAAAVPEAVRRMVPAMPHYPMHTDWIVFGYLAGITLLSGCLASMVPAAESLRTNLNGSLRHQESGIGAGGKRLRLRELLVVVQVAMSLVLVTGAALFARTQYRLFMSDPGFDARRILVAPLASGLPATEYEDLTAKLRAIPTVDSVAFTSSVFWARIEGVSLRTGNGNSQPAAITAVSANFFQTLGIPVVTGRPPAITEPHSLLAAESSAEVLWPGAKAVGQKLEAGGEQWEMSGVVRESELDRRSPVPRLYRVVAMPGQASTVVIRCGDPAAVSRVMSSMLLIAGVEQRELPRTVEDDLAEMGSRFRATASFALFFGASAFALALIGLYGVMAFAVSRRRREMGIRLALGATRANIVQEVLRSGLRPVFYGIGAGLPLAGAFAFGLQYAFRMTPTPFRAADPMAFLPITLLLVAGSLAAMLKPALRACSANPADSLRQD